MYATSEDLQLDTSRPTDLGNAIEQFLDRVFFDSKHLLDPDDSTLYIDEVKTRDNGTLEFRLRLEISQIGLEASQITTTSLYISNYVETKDHIEHSVRVNINNRLNLPEGVSVKLTSYESEIDIEVMTAPNFGSGKVATVCIGVYYTLVLSIKH